MAELPIPRTATDQWLEAVHTELVGLRADLAVARGGEQPASGEPQVLTEPESKPQPARRSSSRRSS